MKHNAFTLAEVLVTLGIIGVVSAMTLPTLMKNHQRQVYVTQLHKVYNVLSQAFGQVITDSNAVNLRESQYGRRGEEWFFRNYFKTTKICRNGQEHECFADDYTNMNGTFLRLRDFVGTSGNGGCAAILADGASVYIYGHIIVDINGKQGPNILGRDLFSLQVDRNGTITGYSDLEDVANNFNNNCSKATEDLYGACFSKILNDGWKMDY